MAGDQDNSLVGKLKKFLLGNTIATNIALGAVGLVSMPLMGALIGANTAWRKSPPANGFRAMAGKAFATLMGGIAGASVGLFGSAVVGVVGLFAGPVGVVAGIGLTALAASYMGKDSAVKQGPAPAATEKSEQKNVQQKGQGKKREREREQEKAQEKGIDQKNPISPALIEKARNTTGKNQSKQQAQPPKGQPSPSKPSTHGPNPLG